MDADDVVRLLDLVEAAGATVWVNGGWGVDALLGEQTRPHADLDLVLEVGDEPALVEALRRNGFGPAYRGDTSAWNYALGDPAGREIDLHVFDGGSTGGSAGAGWYGPPDARLNVFTPWTRQGRGSVAGRDVRTLRPEVEIGFHSGYAVDDDDWHDVSRIAERFGLTVPPDYDRFRPGVPPVAERVAVAAGPVEPREVEVLLRLLPDWFGQEDPLLSYVDDARTVPAVAARDEAGHLVGVALLAEHATGSPEVHLMAVHPAWRGHGVGRRLVDACAGIARGDGNRLLQVKTLGPSDPHAGYARTRSFYLAAGFVPVEELEGLWGATPCLLMVAPL